MENQSFVKNAANETEVKNAGEKVERGRELELSDVRFLLGTVQGRRFIWRYLETCGIYRSSFTGSSETFFLEGQRNVGLKLMADVTEADAQMYARMMLENKKEKVNEHSGKSSRRRFTQDD